MGTVRIPHLAGICAALCAGSVRAVESFDYGFELESPAIADLDGTSTITGAPGSEIPFTVFLTLGTAGDGEHGVQGWSSSVWMEGYDIHSVSDAGTVSAPKGMGGMRDEGFFQFMIIDPERNEGRKGVMQAVALSLFYPVALPLNHRYRVGRVECSATITLPGRIAFARYEEGLVGEGQPVTNILTVEGQSRSPQLEHRDIIIGENAAPVPCPGCEPPPREVCDDGEDNDGDRAVDCEDSECLGRPPCPPVEICGDGLDNERDGFADCTDGDCAGHPFCIAREDCDDSMDNDGDGFIDCEDVECSGVSPCPLRESCVDFMDNDGDGDVDCDDSDCNRSPRCALFEICADGDDNNGDGLVDCEDPMCSQGPLCARENCDDGIDNDDDGLIDCEDPQCTGIGPCPGPERCRDGRDNDQDGLLDCEDPDCTRRSDCRIEICEGGLDEDLDGLIDCDDPECAGSAICPIELCDNGVDDDGDGFADCDDPGCWPRAPCSDGASGFDLVLVADGAVRDEPVQRGGGGGGPPVGPANVLELSYVGTRTIEVVTYVVPYPRPQPEGVQGWSLSISHDSEVLDIVGVPTIEETDAGDLFSSGFEVTEEVGGGAAEGRGAGDEAAGIISAVVLALTQPITLDPTVAQSVLRTTYQLGSQVGLDGTGPAVVAFRDGLRGAGRPVSNLLTVAGSSVEPLHLVPLEVHRTGLYQPFVRGDANGDGKVDLADAVWALNELVRGGSATACRSATDANDDGGYDIADPVYIVQYQFLDGPAIPPPFPQCGVDGEEEVGLHCPEAPVACAQ